MKTQEHWEQVYQGKDDAELSWFKACPETSLSLIDVIHPKPRRVIDVGGGQSALAGELVRRGIEHVTVLDISSAAIERAKQSLGAQAGRVQWMVADILTTHGLRNYDLWHDRAVFHFLVNSEDQRRYVETASRAVTPGGHMIVATFAATGPEQCSGLPVHRYDAMSLAATFAPAFEKISEASETHVTPWGKQQDFVYVVLRRAAE